MPVSFIEQAAYCHYLYLPSTLFEDGASSTTVTG